MASLAVVMVVASLPDMIYVQLSFYLGVFDRKLGVVIPSFSPVQVSKQPQHDQRKKAFVRASAEHVQWSRFCCQLFPLDLLVGGNAHQHDALGLPPFYPRRQNRICGTSFDRESLRRGDHQTSYQQASNVLPL